MNNVVIAVITCKRPEWLARLLDSLIALQYEASISPQILVVDNDSAGSSRDVVITRQQNASMPVTYDVEKKQGIVFARNRCVERFLEMDGDYLVFIDDDEWPQQSDWLNRLVNAASEFNVDVVTSHVISVGEPGTPDWAVDLIYGKNPFQHGQFIDVFYTNNLLLSRKMVAALSPCFDSRFAMTGARDYHFALRAKHAGFKCVYIDAPVVEEFPKSRASVKWFCRRGFRSGIGYTRSHVFEESYGKAVLRCVALSGVRVVRGVAKIVTGIITNNKTTRVDGLFRLCSAAGTIAGLFGIKHEEYKVIHGK